MSPDGLTGGASLSPPPGRDVTTGGSEGTTLGGVGSMRGGMGGLLISSGLLLSPGPGSSFGPVPSPTVGLSLGRFGLGELEADGDGLELGELDDSDALGDGLVDVTGVGGL